MQYYYTPVPFMKVHLSFMVHFLFDEVIVCMPWPSLIPKSCVCDVGMRLGMAHSLHQVLLWWVMCDLSYSGYE